MTYELAARIAQQGGSLYFAAIFLGGVLYALWPRNRETFRRGAEMALSKDDADDRPL
jgi:cytochrome c oxidase cbb3-type subunit 4